MRRGVIFPVVLAFVFSGCATMGPKEQAGTVIGGAGGALIGSQVGGGSGRLVGVAIGTLAGALIGQEIGKSLDRADRQAMESSAQRALEYNKTNEPSTWHNPDSGHRGSTTPRRTYRTAEGRYCREYQQTVIIGGEEHQAYGTACRQPDGSWKIVK
ncbi:MAG: glycine zipper 2TM domain-containing protein [Deltaproteobacteria bacterium]|nr:glycine zipper 2TM domain-containing protein [Deltaproteobacteria bacterium]